MVSPAQKLWIAIALIVFQLVTGGNALAMPMSQAPVEPAPMSDCPEHAAHHDQVAEAVHSPVADSPSDQGGAEEKDCCKYGGCECPCLHGGVAGLAQVEPGALFVEVAPVISPIVDRPHSRPNLLFRPPA